MKTGEPSAAPGWLDVERAVEAFERAHARGGAADPAAFCPPPGDPLHLPVAAELVRADLEFAARTGRPKRLDDYRVAFPALFADPRALAGAAFEEYRLRRQAGEAVAPDEYRARYGVDPSAWAADGRSGPAGAGDGPPRDRLGVTSLFAGLPAAARVAARDLELEAGRFPEPGAEVVGFRLVRELGRGAFARVYLAEQADLAGRFVALKLSTRLVAEAQTLARLQHTNIVPVYSVHRAGRFHAVCMPYLGSATLADVLHRLRDQGSVPLTAEGLGRDHLVAVVGGLSCSRGWAVRPASFVPPAPSPVTFRRLSRGEPATRGRTARRPVRARHVRPAVGRPDPADDQLRPGAPRSPAAPRTCTTG